ncbi:MAG: hypothetical protein EXQ96_05430 [Alphaproteobacteria bacterium]|nr:hypothetical protein [Alphaproteobacteria bacterium]
MSNANFSVIGGNYANNGTSNSSNAGQASFVFDGDGDLIFDPDGNAAGNPGFTIATVLGGAVAAGDVQITTTAIA